MTGSEYTLAEKPALDVLAALGSAKDKTGQAFEQIKQYERDIPRLFLSSLYNIISNGIDTLYGATAASSEYWGRWIDPWPKKTTDFTTDLERDLYSLCSPDRVLDILAHFTVFERRDQQIAKKVCRYQQFRAVNKLVQRVADGQHRRGLIWHTQGSGKSLTMVFAVLKLKWHLGLQSDALTSPNILVLTDRVDLDEQITQTFKACGLPNPRPADNKDELRALLHGGSTGLTVLSTIFKFEGLSTPVANSSDWIVLVDECHRTQEKDLGAFLPHVEARDAAGKGGVRPVVLAALKGDRSTVQLFLDLGVRLSLDDPGIGEETLEQSLQVCGRSEIITLLKDRGYGS